MRFQPPRDYNVRSTRARACCRRYHTGAKARGDAAGDSMPTSQYLDAKIETATLKQVKKVQEANLARQLDYLFARSLLFYREKFQAAGIRRKDYRRLRDLVQFPFTTKEELRESQAAQPPL